VFGLIMSVSVKDGDERGEAASGAAGGYSNVADRGFGGRAAPDPADAALGDPGGQRSSTLKGRPGRQYP
jgi:hypothetical protein